MYQIILKILEFALWYDFAKESMASGGARARGAVLGLAMCWSRGGPCGQVRAVVSGAPGSFGPAPGRSGPAWGWSLAVPIMPRPHGSSVDRLGAARGHLCAESAWCEKMV